MHIAQTDTGPDGVVVASGGFSSLHLGEHEGRPVAVKVMRIRRLYTDIEVYTSVSTLFCSHPEDSCLLLSL